MSLDFFLRVAKSIVLNKVLLYYRYYYPVVIGVLFTVIMVYFVATPHSVGPDR
jgi:hypothetical protein